MKMKEKMEQVKKKIMWTGGLVAVEFKGSYLWEIAQINPFFDPNLEIILKSLSP